jgi:hypothetical protein
MLCISSSSPFTGAVEMVLVQLLLTSGEFGSNIVNPYGDNF